MFTNCYFVKSDREAWITAWHITLELYTENCSLNTLTFIYIFAAVIQNMSNTCCPVLGHRQFYDLQVFEPPPDADAMHKIDDIMI